MKYFIMMVLWVCIAQGFTIRAGDPPKENAVASFPQFPDLVYEYHIAELNKATPLDLSYNQYVRRYIDIFTIERRTQIERFMGLSEAYFPVFEDFLQRYDLPLELKYLAVVESGLDPLARSPSNAIGLWQFLYPTAQMFDLRVTSYIDERCDVYKSTDAACRYLKYLYRTFGDWNLALAAYNGGPGELEKAIARSGGEKEFWDLYPYITEAMRNYVPAFIAVNYVFNNAGKHLLTPAPRNPLFVDLDTLQVHQKISFSSICQKIGMDENAIRQLNPCYRLSEIPYMGQPMTLVLPRDKAIAFLKAENQIIATRKNVTDILPEQQQDMTSVQYSVQKGDFLHKIAMRYGCTVDDICRWNRLSDKNLSAGMKLVIWTKSPTQKW
ncbi:MAG: transglycosylase SLT domain-containing protein [Bacteroidales bacterium]|nr:transglycosylase SLT domain-containing protein [Bacteroidales bacterium]